MRTFGLASIVVLILGLTVVLMACAPAAPAPAPPTAAPKPAAEVAAPAPPTAAPKPAAEVAAPAPPTTAPKPAAEVAAPAPPTTAPKPAAPVAAPAAPTPVVPAKLEKVKLAVFRKGGAFAPFWFARDKGFYQAEGLDVEIVEVAPLLHAPGLVSGEIDYTAIALAGEVFTPIVAKGLPAKILMVTHAEAPWYVIGGPGVTTLNDLKGKAIGVNIGAITHMAVRAALKDKGMDPDKDVTYVSLSSQDRYPALASGAVAATFIGSPEYFEAQQRYGYKILIDLRPIVQLPVDGLAASDRKLREKPKEVKGMIRGTLRGFRSYRDNPQESLQYLTKEFNYSPEVANVLYKDQMQELSFDGIITDKAAQSVFDFEVAAGNIPADLVGKVQPQKGIDMTLLQEVLKEGL